MGWKITFNLIASCLILEILNIRANPNKDEIILKSVVSTAEFKRLNGCLKDLVVFPAERVTEPTKAIKTGARHSYARYLLLPVKLRRIFRTDTHDFENIKCGAVECDGELFLVFGLERKGKLISVNDEN